MKLFDWSEIDKLKRIQVSSARSQKKTRLGKNRNQTKELSKKTIEFGAEPSYRTRSWLPALLEHLLARPAHNCIRAVDWFKFRIEILKEASLSNYMCLVLL